MIAEAAFGTLEPDHSSLLSVGIGSCVRVAKVLTFKDHEPVPTWGAGGKTDAGAYRSGAR